MQKKRYFCCAKRKLFIMTNSITDTLQQNILRLSPNACEEYKYITPPAITLSDIAAIKKLMQLLRSLLFDQKMDDLQELYRVLNEQIHPTEKTAQALALEFIDQLPEIKRLLATDVKAVFDGDPAATDYAEVIVCYPAIAAMLHYRVAHQLLKMNIPLLPRIITELAHSATGIDIHPGRKSANISVSTTARAL
jgi:serine O-acetyltransferase